MGLKDLEGRLMLLVRVDFWCIKEGERNGMDVNDNQ